MAVHTPITIGHKTLVFLDLETTGLEADCDILQIAALYGRKLFNRYIWPSKPIHRRAYDVHKIAVDHQRRHMYVGGQRVEQVDERRAMTDFVEFLSQVPGPVVLVAHNGRRFDFPRLMRAMQRQRVEMPSNVVSLLDTLPTFRSLWPRLQSYKLQELVKQKLDRQPDTAAHDAANDTRTLQQLVAFVPPARHVIIERYLDDLSLPSVEQCLGALSLSPAQSANKD